MQFTFEVYDRHTIRKNPTTQVAIRVDEWPDNVFLLWFPESVSRLRADGATGRPVQDSLWDNYTPGIAHQDFARTATAACGGAGRLSWAYDGQPDVAIEADLTPRTDSIRLEVRVTNRSGQAQSEVSAQSCFHLSAAPDFSCADMTRIYLRSGGEWRALSSLEPTSDFPMYYRPGFFADGRPDRWGGRFSESNQRLNADHPLIVCLARDGDRAVGTASSDYQCLFHNAHHAYLRCIHSQQAPVRLLQPGERATFCQTIYFTQDGLAGVISAYEADTSLDSYPGRGRCLPQ